MSKDIKTGQYWISETYQVVFDCSLKNGEVTCMLGTDYITFDEHAFRGAYSLLDKKDGETMAAAIRRHVVKCDRDGVVKDLAYELEWVRPSGYDHWNAKNTLCDMDLHIYKRGDEYRAILNASSIGDYETLEDAQAHAFDIYRDELCFMMSLEDEA